MYGGRIPIVTQDDWSLHRQGHMDQQRHREKVLEAIRESLVDIVAEESIIMADGKSIVKVPIYSLEEYRFRFDYDRQNHVGQGDGRTQVGDVVGRAAGRGAGSGAGSGAGDAPGVDYYEAEITVDELAELIFEDLGLPNLERKRKPHATTEGYTFNDVRRHGVMANLDRRRTLLEAIKRQLLRGGDGAARPAITKEDLRFKTWDEVRRDDASAVVMAMMDTSGSMGTFAKYVARSFFFWMVRFLRTRYHSVQIVFLAHDTEAREVTEEQFFSKGESGGTRCSSVYELALQIIDERYAPSDYNLYPFHFSDGDNFPSDNERSLQLMRRLVEVSAAAGYAEIVGRRPVTENTLGAVLRQIQDERFVTAVIREKQDVYPVLRRFFRKEAG